MGTVIVAVLAVLVGFVFGRRHERRRIKYVSKPLNTQDVLGVWKYEYGRKN